MSTKTHNWRCKVCGRGYAHSVYTCRYCGHTIIGRCLSCAHLKKLREIGQGPDPSDFTDDFPDPLNYDGRCLYNAQTTKEPTR